MITDVSAPQAVAATTTVGPGGAYTAAPLKAGSYKVEFRPKGNALAAFYGGATRGGGDHGDGDRRPDVPCQRISAARRPDRRARHERRPAGLRLVAVIKDESPLGYFAIGPTAATSPRGSDGDVTS